MDITEWGHVPLFGYIYLFRYRTDEDEEERETSSEKSVCLLPDDFCGGFFAVANSGLRYKERCGV